MAKKATRSLGSIDIQRVSVSKLKLAPYNPRIRLRPGMPEWDRLQRSIEKFAYVDPLIWNKRTGNLVGGHQRLAVLVESFGVKEVDVSVVNLSSSEEKLLNLALNKVAGDWDDAALASLLADIRHDESIDETLSGFDDDEFADLLGEVAEMPMEQIDTRAPPKMAWVLLGIAAKDFGQISADVERLASVSGVLCETTVTDG